MMSPTLGYIKVNRFAESTYLEFENGIEHLILKGAINLVLDLRDNPGGFLQIAEQMADEFLDKGAAQYSGRPLHPKNETTVHTVYGPAPG